MGEMDYGCHQAILAHLENHGLDPDKVREVRDTMSAVTFYKTVTNLHHMVHELDEWRPVETQEPVVDDATLIPGVDVLLRELEEYVFECRGVLHEDYLSIRQRRERVEARLSAMLSLIHHLGERLAPVETQDEEPEYPTADVVYDQRGFGMSDAEWYGPNGPEEEGDG